MATYSVEYEIIDDNSWGTHKVDPNIEAKNFIEAIKEFEKKHKSNGFERHEIKQIALIR